MAERKIGRPAFPSSSRAFLAHIGFYHAPRHPRNPVAPLGLDRLLI